MKHLVSNNMKITMIISALLLSLAMSACAQNKSVESKGNDNMDKKILVAYFSATGTTAREARLIAEATSATLYEIQPEQAYTPADLDWHDSQSRSSVEMNDDASRPPLKGEIADIEQYDVVFLGYPIWWDIAPRPVYTFIDKNDLKGKTVVPFATSGGSTITGSVKDLRSKYPDIKWEDGKLLNGAGKSAVEKWMRQMHFCPN